MPESVPKLGMEVVVQKGAGALAGFEDAAYESAGASMASTPEALFSQADVVLKVLPPSLKEAGQFKEGCSSVSYLYPLANLETMRALSSRGVTAFALEMMPRISRAQSMDTLSSQANLAGYRAVVIAAQAISKIFPLMMTAAGTIAPARVLVIGAGVAGLQAIATARRLGALVEAYDVRPAVKEQVESLGAKFVELPLQAAEAQGQGGYAKAQSEEFYMKQTELLARTIASADIVITTALVPGKPAPKLISGEAVKGMRTGSVVVDLAAEQGGNCELTEPGKGVTKHGVLIEGPLNIASTVAPQASTLFSRNVTSYLLAVTKGGALSLDTGDELVKGPLVLLKGEPVYDPLKAALGSKP